MVYINFIGSDAHNINRRNTGLSTALDLINKSTIKNIFKESSEKILNNGEVKFLGEKIKEKKSIFWFLKR